VARPAARARLARYAAPAAFLAAVTIAVLLIRSGLGAGPSAPATTTSVAVSHPRTTPAHRRKKHRATTRPTHAGYYVVQSGDTFGTIAAREGITVGRLEQLNPGVSSSALAVGQRIRVK
jgi:predicted Zn-dependent protease